MNFFIDISDREFNNFSRMIEESSGIKLGDHKKELLKNRLRKRLNALNLTSFSGYLSYLKEEDADGTELANMLNAISTNVTFFFREEDHFIYLKNRVIPELLSRKAKTEEKKIRCWSAGCSTGEEPYSISITIHESLNTNEWDVNILATDVSTRVLDVARKGIYKIKALDDLPSQLIKRNFYRGVGDYDGHVMVKERLKEMVRINYLNLMDRSFSFKDRFDFIFCRNVMIYFDKPTQKELLCKFHRHLDDGGHLFLGHSEGLTGTHSGFKYVAPAVYVKQ